jgi:predicted PurR-regulated permease PerM
MTLTTAQRQTLSWLALGAAAALALWTLAPVLTPFLIAAVLAYALQPAVEAMATHRVPRALTVLLVELALIVAVMALLLLVVPILSKQLPLLRDQAPQLLDRLNHTLAPWLAQFGITVTLDVEGLKAMLVRVLDGNTGDWLATALSSARIGGSVALTLIGNAVLVPVALFYLLLDWPHLVRHLGDFIPPRLRGPVEAFVGECDGVLGQYLRGQLLVMIVLAVYYSVALAIARFDLALPLGVLTGLAVFIPYLGFGIGLLLALLAGALQFGGVYGVVAVAVVYGFGQVFEGFFLTPRLVGERIGLSPLAVIFALLAFGQIFGFAGVLVALPASAVLVVALRRLRTLYLGSTLYRG